MMDADGRIDPTFFSTCRLCVSTPGSYQILPQIQLQIKELFDIQVDAYDGLPQLLCDECRSIVTKLHIIRCDFQRKQQQLVMRTKNLLAPEDPEEKKTDNKEILKNTVSPTTETITSDTEIDAPNVKDEAMVTENIWNSDAGIEIRISYPDQSPRDSSAAEAQSEKWQEKYNCKFCMGKFSRHQIEPHLETHSDLIALQTQHKIKDSFVRMNRVGEGGNDAKYVHLMQGTKVSDAFGNYFPSSHLNNEKIKKCEKPYKRIRRILSSSSVEEISDEPVIVENLTEANSSKSGPLSENNELTIDANEEHKVPENIEVEPETQSNQSLTKIDSSHKVLLEEQTTIENVTRNIFQKYTSNKPSKRDKRLKILKKDTTFVSLLQKGPITLEWTQSLNHNNYELQAVKTKEKDPNRGFKSCDTFIPMVNELEESLLKPSLKLPSPNVISLSDDEENTARNVNQDAPIIVVTTPLLPPSVIISTGCNQSWLQPQPQPPQPLQPPQPTPQPEQQFLHQSHPQQSLLVIQSQQPQQLIQTSQPQQLPHYQLIQPQSQQVPDQSFISTNLLQQLSVQQPPQLSYQPSQQISLCSQPSSQQYQPQVQSQPQQPRPQQTQQYVQQTPYSPPIMQGQHQLQLQQLLQQPQQPPQPKQIQPQYLQTSQRQYQPQTQVQLQQPRPQLQHQSFQQIQQCPPQPLTQRSSPHYPAQPLHQPPQTQFSPSQQQSLQSQQQLQRFQSPPPYPSQPSYLSSPQQQSQRFRQPRPLQPSYPSSPQQQSQRFRQPQPQVQQNQQRLMQQKPGLPLQQSQQPPQKMMRPSSSGIRLIENMLTDIPPARPVLKCKPSSALLSNRNQRVEQTQQGVKPLDTLLGMLRAEGLALVEDNSDDSTLNLRALACYSLKLGCQTLWISLYVAENRGIFCVHASDGCGRIAIRQESAANQIQILKSVLSYTGTIERNAVALSGDVWSATHTFLSSCGLMVNGQRPMALRNMPATEPSNLQSITEINSQALDITLIDCD